MKRLGLAFALFAFLCVEAHAQLAGGLMFPGPGMPASAGGGYVGPGNAVSGAWAAYGPTCYTAAYSGNAVDVVDSATGNTTGSRLQCSNGILVALVSSSACTFVTGNACSSIATTCATACSVVTLYDQSGNANCTGAVACNVTQSTNSFRPTYHQTCAAYNNQPCMSFVGSSTQQLVSSATATLAQPFTIVTAAERTGATTSLSDWFGNSNFDVQALFGNATNTISQYANSAIKSAACGGTTCNDNVAHSIIEVFNDASASFIYADGVSTTSTGTGTTGIATANLIIGGGNNNLTGQIAELLIYSSALSSGNASTMCHNQFTRLATANSC